MFENNAEIMILLLTSSALAYTNDFSIHFSFFPIFHISLSLALPPPRNIRACSSLAPSTIHSLCADTHAQWTSCTHARSLHTLICIRIVCTYSRCIPQSPYSRTLAFVFFPSFALSLVFTFTSTIHLNYHVVGD